jgi:D-alanyl-D-alanine carboxypeptidase/D-alanyl-D-alanine-endopeptidase (penicillin-binding protein 4)
MKAIRLLVLLVLAAGWGVAGWLWTRQEQPIASVQPIETAPIEPKADPLQELAAQWAGKPGFMGATLGIAILGADGDKLAELNDEFALVPASALKTLTSGAALEHLGAEFAFETIVTAQAEVSSEGVLQGDLVLVGSGDPTLSAADLEKLADAVFATGLKTVSGGVIGDASAFPEAGASDHWNWGDVGNAFGAGVYGLNIDHNRYEARFESGAAVGDPARFLGSTPELPGVTWRSLVTTGPPGSGDGVMIHSGPYATTVTLRGTVPAGESEFTVGGAIPDPPALAALVFDRALRARGVTIAAEPKTTHGAATAPAVQQLASQRSAPLSKIVPHLHEVSDNVEAQALLLKLGGTRALREFWEGRGVRFAGLRLEDGSGLARASRIRPGDLARANYLARHGTAGEMFRESLSASRNGTVRSKTGAMSGVRAEVGFLTREDGTELTFAIIGNGLTQGAEFWTFRAAVLDVIAAPQSSTSVQAR